MGFKRPGVQVSPLRPVSQSLCTRKKPNVHRLLSYPKRLKRVKKSVNKVCSNAHNGSRKAVIGIDNIEVAVFL